MKRQQQCLQLGTEYEGSWRILRCHQCFLLTHGGKCSDRQFSDFRADVDCPQACPVSQTHGESHDTLYSNKMPVECLYFFPLKASSGDTAAVGISWGSAQYWRQIWMYQCTASFLCLLEKVTTVSLVLSHHSTNSCSTELWWWYEGPESRDRRNVSSAYLMIHLVTLQIQIILLLIG